MMFPITIELAAFQFQIGNVTGKKNHFGLVEIVVENVNIS